MKLPHPFVQLPLLFDATRLDAEIAALGEGAWLPHPQGFPGNSMLPLISRDGRVEDESFAGRMAPTPHLDRCAYLRDTIAALGVVAGRTRLMRLSGHSEVTRHADQGYYWADRVRVHVPVVTQPTVRFDCGDVHTNMAAGECWIFDTWRQHRVLNDDTRSRIHLVVDTVGSDEFWALVDRGRTHDGRALTVPWQPRVVAPSTGAPATLLFERDSFPVVMTPWEMADRLRFLLDEAEPGPAIEPLRAATERFLRSWRWLWARFGTHAEGWPAFKQLGRTYLAEVVVLAENVSLRNELSLHGAITSVVRRVGAAGAEALPDATPSAAIAAAPMRVAAPAGIPGVSASMSWGSSGAMRWGTPAAPAPAPAIASAAASLSSSRAAGAGDPVFDRPVFIVSSPRSGSTMLFEALATAPGVHTIGGESHGLIEGVPALNPATRGFDSNRLLAADATPGTIDALRRRFLGALRDRNGQPPAPGRVRMLEKTPKNSLRIPFLASVFPEGVFVYLHRDPREVLGSMIDAWSSGRFRTYPNLPGWNGPWSLLLIPGWRELVGLPLATIVARQWETTTRLLLDDLEALPPERRVVVRYGAVVADPQKTLSGLAAAVGLGWDRDVGQRLPNARYTLSDPAADKWRRHEVEILRVLPQIQATIDRAARFAGT